METEEKVASVREQIKLILLTFLNKVEPNSDLTNLCFLCFQQLNMTRTNMVLQRIH